jgi:hypothetical protein
MSEALMSERRRETRLRSLLTGQVLLGARTSTMDCTVRNLSEHGALMLSPETFRLPPDFDLHIPHREETFAATIAWRRHDRAGLTLSPAVDEPARRMTAAQKSRAALKAAQARAAF